LKRSPGANKHVFSTMLLRNANISGQVVHIVVPLSPNSSLSLFWYYCKKLSSLQCLL